MKRWSPALAFALAAALPFVGVQLSSAQPRRPAASASASASASAPPPGSGSASASAAAPAASVAAEIMVLHANNSGGGIDPKVRDLPQLKKPPFSSYNTYRVLAQSRTTLPLGRNFDTTLPNGSLFRIAFKEALSPGRSKLAASILQPDGKPFLPQMEVTLPRDEPFFIGAQSYRDGKQDGKLVLAVKLLKLARKTGPAPGESTPPTARHLQPAIRSPRHRTLARR